MTEDQLRIEQAKLMGYKFIQVHLNTPEHPMAGYWRCVPPNPKQIIAEWLGSVEMFTELYLPPIDHNSVAQCRAGLSEEGRIKFIHALGLDVLKLCPLAGDYWMAQELDCWLIADASPHDQLRAILKVKGII